jgi:hypothetical protein
MIARPEQRDTFANDYHSGLARTSAPNDSLQREYTVARLQECLLCLRLLTICNPIGVFLPSPQMQHQAAMKIWSVCKFRKVLPSKNIHCSLQRSLAPLANAITGHDQERCKQLLIDHGITQKVRQSMKWEQQHYCDSQNRHLHDSPRSITVHTKNQPWETLLAHSINSKPSKSLSIKALTVDSSMLALTMNDLLIAQNIPKTCCHEL